MEQQPESRAGEMMVFGLIEQADRMGKSAQGTQRALAEQIEELGELQEWAEGAAQELQKRADAAIKSLEAERVQWQGARVNLEHPAVQAIHDAVRKQSGDIERQTVQAFAAPLQEIQQAAGHVRQNVRDSNWMLYVAMLLIGVVLGLFAGYLPMRGSVKALEEHVTLIDQYLAAQQPPVLAPAVPDMHAPARKGKAK